jgi:hypothetical protein
VANNRLREIVAFDDNTPLNGAGSEEVVDRRAAGCDRRDSFRLEVHSALKFMATPLMQ